MEVGIAYALPLWQAWDMRRLSIPLAVAYLTIALLAAALSGCTHLDGANEQGGLVYAPSGPANAMREAEAHCSQYGRTARISGALPQREYSFDCMPR